MTRPKLLKNVDLNLLRAYLMEDGDDGWTIWGTERFTRMGFAKKDLPNYKHKSGTGKEAIYRSDGSVGDVSGIHNLRLLSMLAGAFNAEYQGAFGRGTEARRITAAVLPKLDELIKAEE